MPTRTGFHLKHKFLVRIGGFVVAKFQSVSEVSSELGKIEYREGGAIYPDISLGLATATDVTLTRAVAVDDEIRPWFELAVNGATDRGLEVYNLRRDVDIEQLGRGDQLLRVYRLFEAQPMKWVAGDWDNSAEEVVAESLTLAYRYPSRVF
jgi:phage tail-like protein